MSHRDYHIQENTVELKPLFMNKFQMDLMIEYFVSLLHLFILVDCNCNIAQIFYDELSTISH